MMSIQLRRTTFSTNAPDATESTHPLGHGGSRRAFRLFVAGRKVTDNPTTFAIGWVKFFELIESPASIGLSGAGDDGVDQRQREGFHGGTQRIKCIADSLRFLREHWPLDTQSASRSADLSRRTGDIPRYIFRANHQRLQPMKGKVGATRLGLFGRRGGGCR